MRDVLVGVDELDQTGTALTIVGSKAAHAFGAGVHDVCGGRCVYVSEV